MTRGKPTTTEKKKAFINFLEKTDGDLTRALEKFNMAQATLKGIKARDAQFRNAVEVLTDAHDEKIARTSTDKLLENIEEGKETSIIYAQKAYKGMTEDGEGRRKGKKSAMDFPLQALRPETLKMIKKDIADWKEKKNIVELEDEEKAEDVDDLEYMGHSVKGGLPVYDPDDEEAQRASPGDGVDVKST